MVCCLLTTLIDSRNPDLEYKIKELNTQVASLKAALHTYVVLLLCTWQKVGLKRCQKLSRDSPNSRNRDSTKGLRCGKTGYRTVSLSGSPLSSIFHFRYGRALSNTTTVKLRDELEDFRSKEASTTSKYEVLLAEIEQVRKNFRSQEHV